MRWNLRTPLIFLASVCIACARLHRVKQSSSQHQKLLSVGAVLFFDWQHPRINLIEYVQLVVEGEEFRLEDYNVLCAKHERGLAAKLRGLFRGDRTVMAYLPVSSISEEISLELNAMTSLSDLVLTEQTLVTDLEGYPTTAEELNQLHQRQRNLIVIDGVNVYMDRYHVNFIER